MSVCHCSSLVVLDPQTWTIAARWRSKWYWLEAAVVRSGERWVDSALAHLAHLPRTREESSVEVDESDESALTSETVDGRSE